MRHSIVKIVKILFKYFPIYTHVNSYEDASFRMNSLLLLVLYISYKCLIDIYLGLPWATSK